MKLSKLQKKNYTLNRLWPSHQNLYRKKCNIRHLIQALYIPIYVSIYVHIFNPSLIYTQAT